MPLRLAVLGSPIEHSLSPVLHAVAYRHLGLPFDYSRAEVGAGSLGPFLDALDPSWRGLSLTMPLKREVMPMLESASPLAERLGVANTVVFSWEGGARRPRLHGHNTDVDGIVRAVRAADPEFTAAAGRTAILGGGATAASALAAAQSLGARGVTAFVRDAARAADLVALGAALGVPVSLAALDAVDNSGDWHLVISTLPGGTPAEAPHPDSSTALLLDVAYDPWPSPLAAAWSTRGGITTSGLDMLVEQAIGQVRLFSGRGQDEPLPHEESIRSSMRQEVGLEPIASAP